MDRTLQPELLDFLAPYDPAARESRRDLRYINRVMGNGHWLRETLAQCVKRGDRLLELGAGDGGLAANWLEYRADALDLSPAPEDWPASSRWHQMDIREFERWSDYSVVFSNLFFHHLPEAALRRVGAELRTHARVIVASEPLRGLLYCGLFAALCPFIGANAVTRHDGHVSIKAGFRADELPRSLGLVDDDRWAWRVETTGLGAYRLVATRP